MRLYGKIPLISHWNNFCLIPWEEMWFLEESYKEMQKNQILKFLRAPSIWNLMPLRNFILLGKHTHCFKESLWSMKPIFMAYFYKLHWLHMVWRWARDEQTYFVRGQWLLQPKSVSEITKVLSKEVYIARNLLINEKEL